MSKSIYHERLEEEVSVYGALIFPVKAELAPTKDEPEFIHAECMKPEEWESVRTLNDDHIFRTADQALAKSLTCERCGEQ